MAWSILFIKANSVEVKCCVKLRLVDHFTERTLSQTIGKPDLKDSDCTEQMLLHEERVKSAYVSLTDLSIDICIMTHVICSFFHKTEGSGHLGFLETAVSSLASRRLFPPC